MKAPFNEYIESKSVTTASTDNKAKRSERNYCLKKCEKLHKQAVIKSSEQQTNQFRHSSKTETSRIIDKTSILITSITIQKEHKHREN